MTTAATPYVTVHGIKIAASLSAFTDCLFRPYEGGTCDGYIERVLKNGRIKLHFRGETYTLNPHHVFCFHAGKTDKGRTWYTYGGELNKLPMRTTADLEDAIRAMVA